MARFARQRGAVLYVVLVMLVLLALLGLAGMQVTGLQERMASNYRRTNLAFQNAERLARSTECGVESLVKQTSKTGCAATISPGSCNDDVDPAVWVEKLSPRSTEQARVREITSCTAGNASAEYNGASNERLSRVFQVTAYSTDGSGDNAAEAAVDTVIIY